MSHPSFNASKHHTKTDTRALLEQARPSAKYSGMVVIQAMHRFSTALNNIRIVAALALIDQMVVFKTKYANNQTRAGDDFSYIKTLSPKHLDGLHHANFPWLNFVAVVISAKRGSDRCLCKYNKRLFCTRVCVAQKAHFRIKLNIRGFDVSVQPMVLWYIKQEQIKNIQAF